jgi:hypothetical protein
VNAVDPYAPASSTTGAAVRAHCLPFQRSASGPLAVGELPGPPDPTAKQNVPDVHETPVNAGTEGWSVIV